MNQQEIEEQEILEKARQIQKKRRELLLEEEKKQKELLKIKKQQERVEQQKKKRKQQQEKKKREEDKKIMFDEMLPQHLKIIATHDDEIKKAEDIVENAKQNLYKVKNKKNEFMSTFYKYCVHSYGPHYSKWYDTYRKCIYCDHEDCVHEMCY